MQFFRPTAHPDRDVPGAQPAAIAREVCAHSTADADRAQPTAGEFSTCPAFSTVFADLGPHRVGIAFKPGILRPMVTYFRGSPHPALSEARLASELSGLSRHVRERDFVKIADELWLPADHPADFESLSVAFSRLYPDSVLTGWSAAKLHGITPPDNSVPELCVGPVGRRRRGLRIRRYRIPESAIEVRRGVRLTSRSRTAFDLARLGDHLDGVLAVEKFYRRGYTQRELAAEVESERGTWGVARARRVLDDAHPLSESPRETETRLFLRDAGFTAFVPQVELRDLGYRLDLADARMKIAVEYDGAHHDDPMQQSKDRIRRNRLQAAGWIVIVLDARIFRSQLDILCHQVRAAYDRRAFEAAA